MATELERRIERLEQRHGTATVLLTFRCETCGTPVPSLDEAQSCGHHRPMPDASIKIIIAFGREHTT